MRDDQTFEEFMAALDVYGFRSRNCSLALLAFYNDVLEEVDKRGGDLPIEVLAHLTGTGITEGAFYTIVAWLNSHGLPWNGDRTGLYLHPVGAGFLDGFRAFSSCPNRWEELAVRFGVDLGEPFEDD